MALRSFKKYASLGIDEEKDFFLASLNKKIRNAKKKLDQIDDLAKKDKSTLKAEQLEKIQSRGEVLQGIRSVEDLKEMYYAAYKTAKEEGKVAQGQGEATSASKQPESEAQESQPQPVQTEEHEEADVVGITREALSKVLNLIHVVQFFRDQGHVQEYKQASGSVPDFESLHEFYVKVFSFSESDKFVRIEDKLNRSLSELESYVNSASQPALRNQSYEFLQNAVQKVVETSFFREHKADVSTRQARSGAEPSAIGSELKKDHHVEPVVAQEKHRSPEKETKAQEPTKVSPVKEAKRDWGSVEDEDEEGGEGLDKLREEEQQEVAFEGEGGRATDEGEKQYTSLRDKQAEEEQKQGKSVDDEWATVTAKHKERKDEKPTRGGYGGNRPYRGGRGDGPRKPRAEGERQGEEGEGRRGGRGGHRGANRGDRGDRGGSSRGGYQKREGTKDDVYQKKPADTVKPAEGH